MTVEENYTPAQIRQALHTIARRLGKEPAALTAADLMTYRRRCHGEVPRDRAGEVRPQPRVRRTMRL